METPAIDKIREFDDWDGWSYQRIPESEFRILIAKALLELNAKADKIIYALNSKGLLAPTGQPENTSS